ncbi:accessory gene regulator B family protein [Clostridium sp. YIM B02555]|uniref:accessory gene regulator B family protein n=1 Tax=Clostridium sp. YIM B02555 TaxID=2911968 RepID=UPI001EEF4713|nr:accessory gene regulator B family protein [Clostridium sp. YIM B02555]
MILSKPLSEKCTKFIKNNTSASAEDLEKIHYGILVIFLTIFKSIILFATAYFLGILEYTLTAFLVFAALRIFASGVHANSTFQCIIINYILFFGNVYLSLNIQRNLLLVSILFLISVALILLYAPADTEERPLISLKLRKSLKIKSIIVIMAFYILALLLHNNIYTNLITFSILEGALVVTPIAYRLFGKKYANYKNL